MMPKTLGAFEKECSSDKEARRLFPWEVGGAVTRK
jgi:hypothetical protein